ncbi:hypothetical protein D3C78_1668880 [compost metagenome]
MRNFPSILEMTSQGIDGSLVSVQKIEVRMWEYVRKSLTILFMLPLLILGACVNKGAEEKDTLTKARENGYITVGFANENPYAYKNANG